MQLQVLVFPLEAGSTGLGDEPDPSFPVDYLPILVSIVEFDIGGTAYFKPAEFMQRQNFSPEALRGSVRGEYNLSVHVD